MRITKEGTKIGLESFLMWKKLEQETKKEPVCGDPFNPKFKQQNYCLFGNLNKDSAKKCPYFYTRKSPRANGCNYNRHIDYLD